MTGIGYVRMEEVPGIPRLPKTPGAVIYAPLGDTPVDPDVVLVSGPARAPHAPPGSRPPGRPPVAGPVPRAPDLHGAARRAHAWRDGEHRLHREPRVHRSRQRRALRRRSRQGSRQARRPRPRPSPPPTWRWPNTTGTGAAPCRRNSLAPGCESASTSAARRSRPSRSIATAGSAARRRVPTPRGRYGATLAAITTLVEGLERESGEPARVGIGMPGALSPATGLREEREQRRGSTAGRSARISSASSTARSASRTTRTASRCPRRATAPARERAVVFGVILGTGTGGGVVVHGRVLGGPNAIAGEWGHNPAALAARRRVAGRRLLLRADGLRGDLPVGARRFPRPSRGHGRGARRDDHRRRAPPTGDARCEATLARYEERLARALATVVNLLDPDVIVLGGGLSNLTRLYAGVPERWGAWVFSDRVDTAAPSSEARRLERRPRSGVALGRGRGRREAEPVAAAYRLTPVRRLANAVVRGLVRLGLGPARTYLLTVPGRRSGQARSTPVTLVESEGQRWLVGALRPGGLGPQRARGRARHLVTRAASGDGGARRARPAGRRSDPAALRA